MTRGSRCGTDPARTRRRARGCYGSPWMEGEAGSPVTVVSLPARGRPPQAAARRAGLEDVEKSLPAPSTARTRRSGTQSMLRVPLVASTGRPGYWLELLVALVVAVAQRRLGPSSSARTSTVEQ